MPPQSFPAFFEQARQRPVFVVLGVQGSGTNLLRSILVNAFQFAVLQDQSIVFNAARALGSDPPKADVQKQFDRILAHLEPSTLTRKTGRIIHGNAPYAGIREHFDSVPLRSAADLALFVYAYGAYSMGTDRMAIKSDDLWEHIAAIDTVIPNRRIVLLTRDFRDNLLSVSKKDFGPIEPLVAADYVHERFVRYDAEFRRTPAAHRLHLRYEDLLTAPLQAVETFGAHFGFPVDPSGRAGVERLKIRSGNHRKWEAALDPVTLSGCEGILRDELLRYGYDADPDATPPPSAAWALAKARDTARRIPQKILKIGNRLRK